MNIRQLPAVVVIALFCLFPHAMDAITVSFGPRQAPDFLDVTFDVSDGHWTVTNVDPLIREWVYDGPSSLNFVHDGWQFSVTAPDSGFGNLSIRAPDRFGQNFNPYGLAYIYLLSELADLPSRPPTPLWVLGDGVWDTPYSWMYNPPKPVIAGSTLSSHNITWNVPDGGTAVALFLPLVIVCLYARRRMTRVEP